MPSTNQQRSMGLAITMMLWVCCAQAQAPVEDGHRTPDTLLDAQQKTGQAYHEWQQAEAARTLAQQEYQQAVQAYESAQQQLAVTKQQATSAKQKFEAAKIQEDRAGKAYEQATRAVDRTWSGDAHRK